MIPKKLTRDAEARKKLLRILRKELLRAKPTKAARVILCSLAIGGLGAIALSLATDNVSLKLTVAAIIATSLAILGMHENSRKNSERLNGLKKLFSLNEKLVWEQTTTNPAKPEKAVRITGNLGRGEATYVAKRRWEKILAKANAAGLSEFFVQKLPRENRSSTRHDP